MSLSVSILYMVVWYQLRQLSVMLQLILEFRKTLDDAFTFLLRVLVFLRCRSSVDIIDSTGL